MSYIYLQEFKVHSLSVVGSDVVDLGEMYHWSHALCLEGHVVCTPRSYSRSFFLVKSVSNVTLFKVII